MNMKSNIISSITIDRRVQNAKACFGEIYMPICNLNNLLMASKDMRHKEGQPETISVQIEASKIIVTLLHWFDLVYETRTFLFS